MDLEGNEMKIEKWAVEIYKLKAMYSDCDIEMEIQSDVLESCPPQYQYLCPKCGKHEISTDIFPKIVMK